MALKQDWLLRQTEELINFLIYLLFGKRATEKEMQTLHEMAILNNPLYRRLYEKLEKGDICGAEDELFDSLNSNEGTFNAGILFYYQLNRQSNSQLLKGNFTRREIMDGLEEFCHHFDMDIRPFIKKGVQKRRGIVEIRTRYKLAGFFSGDKEKIR